MKKYIATVGMLVVPLAFASSGTTWIHEATPELRRSVQDISPRNYREVDSSKLGTAESALAQQSFAPLTEDQLRYYVDTSFKCINPSLPFLVRAVYGHRGTGGYVVQQYKSALIVTHGSLGHTTPSPTKSAMVVCADSVSEVFVSLGVDE
jgi:hypothetical protein